jgi:putative membrane protein
MKALALQMLVVAQSGDWNGHHDLDGGWWIVMMIGMVLFWALVIVAVVWAVRAMSHGNAPSTSARRGETPLEILEHRFAQGEIDAQEFEERRATLTGGPSPG